MMLLGVKQNLTQECCPCDSQSSIGPLEDILDNGYAGDLLLRFEEKHTLDDSVDDSSSRCLSAID